MGPLTHHPQWYRSIGAINDDELAASLKSGTSATTPVISKLEFGSPAMTVQCLPNLWSIQSTTDSSWNRMLRTASLVFAKANNPTLTALGLMVQRHIDANCNVKSILAASAAELNLGLPVGTNVNTNITLANVEEGYTVTTSVQTSVLGERVVFGLYHCDYPTREIERISDGRFEKFIAASSKFFTDIVAAINARARGGKRR
jgi:hypothetical protein